MGFFVVATIFISCTYDANVIILVRMVGRDWIRRQTKTTYCFCLLAIKADSRGFTNELTQDVHGAQRENQVRAQGQGINLFHVSSHFVVKRRGGAWKEAA